MVQDESTEAKVIDHLRFDLSEFADRWSRARISALKSALLGVSVEITNPLIHEKSLLALVALHPEAEESVLRNVFDKSRKFGSGAVRFLGVSFEISDLAEILPYLGTPCFRERWRVHNAAQVLERSGCSSLADLGSFGCDYWREALDGLVMGVGENERLARHKSRGHGDSECVDVLFAEEYSLPRVLKAEGDIKSLRFGPVPIEVEGSLQELSHRFAAMKVRLYLDGLSEGTLFYRLEADEGVLCGAGGKLMHDSVSREISQKFPSLIVKDAAPLAVYGGST